MKTVYSPTIFVVDENPVYAKLVQQYLEVADYTEVLTITRTGECLRYLDLHPDIIITEFNSSDISVSGINLLNTIKRKCPDTAIVFLTSRSSVEDAVKAIRHGAAEYIIKSKYALDSLVHKVNRIITFRRELINYSRTKKRLVVSLSFLIVLTLFLVYFYIY